MNTSVYSVMYVPDLSISIGEYGEVVKLKNDEVVSISIMNAFDTATFPIIRLRLQCDVELLELLTKDPDNLYLVGRLDGAVYDINKDDEDNRSPIRVRGADTHSLYLKIYLESKNTPVSEADRYDTNGLLKSNEDLGNTKVPLQLYCYDARLAHACRMRCNGIYKDLSIETVLDNICSQAGIQYSHDKFTNAKKYDQILIPNLNIIDAFAFIETRYGTYEKGGLLYASPFISDGKLKLVDSACDRSGSTRGIIVDSKDSTADMCGVRVSNTGYNYAEYMCVPANGVSVITETDLDRVLNAEYINAINLNTLDVDTAKLSELFDGSAESIRSITTPDTLHKNMSEYVASGYAARINEGITKVDISTSGWPINLAPTDRFMLMFNSPMRGLKMNSIYRATFVNAVLTNVSGDMYIASMTMRLVKN